jgi:penicillin amidase
LNNDANSSGAAVFQLWWYFLMKNVWEDEFPSDKMLYPSRAVTARLITQDTVRKWWDDVRTKDKRETFVDQLNLSFRNAVDSLKRRFPQTKDWTLAKLKGTYIPHITRNQALKALGRYDIKTGGGVGIVNATNINHGPSWRMVVSMGPYVRGFGIFPGGQSGHPASAYYDNMIDKWAKGELEELHFMRKYNPEIKNRKAVWKMQQE